MFSLQSFCFEAFFVYEPKVDSFKAAFWHSWIGLLINNSTRFKSSMHKGFVSTSTHEVLRCHNKFWKSVATLALGLRPRQRELQGCGPKGSSRVKPRGSLGVKPRGCPGVKARESPRVTSHTPGSVRKC
jgi:hypothetical protein